MDSGEIKAKLIKIKVCLQDVIDSRQRFSETFSKWQENRTKNIEYLETLATNLSYHKQNVNISTTVGSSVGILGGIAGIVGAALLPFPGLNIASPFLLYGGVSTCIAGSTTSVGSVIVGECLNSSAIKDAKERLTEDKDQLSNLNEWFEKCEDYQRAVNQLMDVKIFGEALKACKSLLKNYNLYDCSESEIMDCLKPVLMMFPFALTSQITSIFTIIFACSPLLHLFIDLVKLRSEFPVIYCTFELSMKVGLTAIRFSDVTVDAVLGVANIAKVSTAVSKPIAQVAVHSVLNIAGVALDVVTLVLSVKDLVNGSPSTHVTAIRNVMEAMKNQLEKYSVFHDALQNLDPDNPLASREYLANRGFQLLEGTT